MIFTKCSFYYGHTISENNSYIDFQEGADPVLVAQVAVGEYSFTDFLNAVALALNDNGTLNYSVSANRATRIVTITADGNFRILGATGVNSGQSVGGLIGIQTDTALALSHTGTFASGSSWEPQFYPQDYVDFEDQQSAIDGVIKQSASGKVETVSFGRKKIMEANFRFITDVPQNNSVIVSDSSAVLKARTFLEYAITKADLEFIPDKLKPETFVKCILESTPEDQNGLGFKLKELYSLGLAGYYETGVLKFRRI